MVYTILISIVFVAEIIIAFTVINALFKLDKSVLKIDNTVTAAKSVIKDISILGKKISEQLIFLSEDFIEKIKLKSEKVFLRELSKAFAGFLLLNLNFKLYKRMKKSRIIKTLAKGFSFIESMI